MRRNLLPYTLTGVLIVYALAIAGCTSIVVLSTQRW